jgi:two-component system response regulator HydG
LLLQASSTIEAVASVPLRTATRVATAPCSLLITGETGVGKGYLARWIHDHGDRRGPLVPVNCGAIPEGVIDSQLFGHVRGAFSDAHRDHDGLVRAAEGGTLFLDEVGELPNTAQLRLLRLLEEREVQPVGGVRPVRVDVRIIAATACDLEQLVAERRFREDLYYRLNVIHFELMPLRERGCEVMELADVFNREFAEQTRTPPFEFSDAALRYMMDHSWPGNVRQLRTVIERLYILCGHRRVTVEHLRTYGQLAEPRILDARPRMDDLRVREARRAVDECDGNISRAADALGVHRSTVHRWLARERKSA